MNMTDTGIADGDHKRMEYGIVRIINLHRPTHGSDYLKAQSLGTDKDPKREDSFCGSADQTQILLHYTVYAL